MIVQSEKVFNKFCKYNMYMLSADPIPRIGQIGLLSKEMQMLSELICLHKYYSVSFDSFLCYPTSSSNLLLWKVEPL